MMKRCRAKLQLPLASTKWVAAVVAKVLLLLPANILLMLMKLIGWTRILSSAL
jgi:lauroyl/myristoyl acyltransferase